MHASAKGTGARGGRAHVAAEAAGDTARWPRPIDAGVILGRCLGRQAPVPGQSPEPAGVGGAAGRIAGQVVAFAGIGCQGVEHLGPVARIVGVHEPTLPDGGRLAAAVRATSGRRRVAVETSSEPPGARPIAPAFPSGGVATQGGRPALIDMAPEFERLTRQVPRGRCHRLRWRAHRHRGRGLPAGPPGPRLWGRLGGAEGLPTTIPRAWPGRPLLGARCSVLGARGRRVVPEAAVSSFGDPTNEPVVGRATRSDRLARPDGKVM